MVGCLGELCAGHVMGTSRAVPPGWSSWRPDTASLPPSITHMDLAARQDTRASGQGVCKALGSSTAATMTAVAPPKRRTGVGRADEAVTPVAWPLPTQQHLFITWGWVQRPHKPFAILPRKNGHSWTGRHTPLHASLKVVHTTHVALPSPHAKNGATPWA